MEGTGRVMNMWPDKTDEPKELCFCPHCGEQKPEAEEGATDWTTPDYQRDEEGYLICEECWCEEDVERRFEPVKVIPLESAKLSDQT